MKKSNWDWVIVVIIIALVIGIGVGIYLSSSDDETNPEQKERASKLDIVKQKIKALEQRVKDEIAQLKLTTEMENALTRKVDRFCMVLGVFFWIIIMSIAAAFYFNGFDLITSILNTAGLASLSFPLVSIILWRTVDFNSVVEYSRRSIKNWLNKRYGHNPDSIATLSNNISKNQNELDLLVSSTSNE